ncbi:TonB-dependent receptor [Steroidobacter sp.]|uniref:TonB-dependent receptor n=1 Tax=Steroidobacter sp. TaxID=1978227 RepID=UPI001A4B777F|nr:TonB-dependent receptor [Steroidobacter sp.]MBL8268064.1 TonB-dependent receptor [Steroidobacter sp.]
MRSPVIAVLATLATTANAQTAEQSQGSGLEEVVVTAQRRSENLQSVPIAVTALTADMLEKQGIGRSLDITNVTPGLVITPAVTAPQIYIRGVGTLNAAPGEESSNAVYVDGVYLAALPSAIFSFNNIERIEVLKGPQGTLFGRNATGGLIQVVTRDPSFDNTYKVDLSYGNYQTTAASAYISGGLSDNVALDLAGSFSDQGEGFGVNRFNGREVGKTRDKSVRSKLLWNVSEDTVIRFAADYSEAATSAGPARSVIPGSVALGGQQFLGDPQDLNFNLHPWAETSGGGASLRIEHDWSWAKLLSISAYREGTFDVDSDQDSTALAIVNAQVRTDFSQLTQELQLQSNQDGRLQWIAGLFYLASETNQTPFGLSGASQAAVGGFTNRFASQDTDSYAVFAQSNYSFTDSTRLTTGVRFSKDERGITGRDETGIGTRNVVDRETSFDSTTWRLALDQKLSDDVMVYGSYSRGFKSGIYNLLAPTAPPVRPEQLDAFEVGLKSELFDRTVRANLSSFYYQYSDIQLSQQVPGGVFLLNAAEATMYGLDAELLAEPFDGLTLRGGLNLLHAEYDSFPGAPYTLPSPATCATNPPSLLAGPRTGGNTTCATNAAGNDMVRAPKWTLNFSADYRWLTSIGAFSASANYYYNDGYFPDPDNRIHVPSYSLVNAEVGWWSESERFGVRLWARNLLDKEYYSNIVTSTGDNGTAGLPRMYGITLSVKH